MDGEQGLAFVIVVFIVACCVMAWNTYRSFAKSKPRPPRRRRAILGEDAARDMARRLAKEAWEAARNATDGRKADPAAVAESYESQCDARRAYFRKRVSPAHYAFFEEAIRLQSGSAGDPEADAP